MSKKLIARYWVLTIADGRPIREMIMPCRTRMDADELVKWMKNNIIKHQELVITDSWDTVLDWCAKYSMDALRYAYAPKHHQ